MKQPGWINEGIILGNKFSAHKQNPFVHNLINLFFFFLLSGAILALFWVSNFLSPILYLPLAIIGFAFCIHCSNILVAHEAAHHMFLISKNEKINLFWNRFFGWMVNIPLGIDFHEYYEEGHYIHHRKPVTPQDPEVCNPRTGSNFFNLAAKNLFIPGYPQIIGILMGKGTDFECPVGSKSKVYWKGIRRLGFFWGVVLLTILALGWSLLSLLAIFLSFQILAFMRLFMASRQHGGPLKTENNFYLRNQTGLYPFRYFMEPFNINYHFDHHLNFNVPWYLLPKYHRALKEMIPQELQSFLFIKEPWKQISGNAPGIPDSLRPLTS